MPSGAPTTGNTAKIKDILSESVTVTPGAVTAAGKTVTTALPGAKVGDKIDFLEVVGGITLGSILTGARVSATDVLELRFSTTIVIGLTLGSTTVTFLRFVF